MSSSTWPADSVSIIVLPSGQDGEALLDLARKWASADLIDRALWVKTDDVKHLENEPLRINAECIGKTADGDVITESTDLFTQLASEYFKTIRFIKVRKASPTRENDDLQDTVVEDCLDALDASLPRQVSIQGESASLTKYQILTLVCSTAQFSVSEEVRTARGGVTIFASPEDRTFPWSSDAFMRDGERFTGFTLMHIATLAGLWVGVPRGLVDFAGIDTKASNGAWIVRTFITGVLTDRLAKRASSDTLNKVLNPTFKPARPPQNCTYILDRNLDEYVDALVDHLMHVDESRLSYDRSIFEVDEKDLRDKRKATAWFGEFFRFSGTKTVQIPSWAWKWMKRAFARYTQRKLIGSEDVAVVSELEDNVVDVYDQIIIDTIKSIEESRLVAQQALATPVKLSQARSTPELWRTVREAIFASVDGGYDLRGNGFPTLEADSRPIFESVANAFPDPSASWEFPDDMTPPEGVPVTVNLQNLHEANGISEILSKWTAEVTSEAASNAAEQVAQSNALADLRTQRDTVAALLNDHDCMITDEDGEAKPVTIADATRIYKELMAQQETLAPVQPEGPSQTEPATPDTVAAVEVENPSADSTTDEESTDSGKEPLSEARATEKPQLFAARAFGWLGPKRQSDEPTVVSSAPQEPSEIPDLPNLVREHKRLVARMKELEPEISKLDALIADSATEQFRREDIAKSFSDWHDAVSRTLYAKMFDRMDNDRKAVNRDLKRLKKEVQGLTAPEPGAMTTARKKFHRGLIVLTVVHAFLALVSAVILPFVAPFLLAIVWPILIGTFISGLIGIYIAYFRAWLNYSRDVTEMRARFERVDSQNRRCTEEKFRLELLHEQALEWLRLLAQFLYHPWAIDPAWSESLTDAIAYDQIPLAMNIAQADVANGDAQVRLVDAAMTRLVEPGWRSAAFEDLVGYVARASGRGTTEFNLDALDNDLPHASNQTREVLATHQDDVTVLQQVAHRRLVRLVEHLQSSTMTEVRPRVLVPDRNPLQRLEMADYDLDPLGTRGGEDWTEFLARTMCSDGMTVTDPTALSTLIVSQNARLDSEFSNVNSVVVAPEYLAENANTGVANHTRVVSNVTGRNLPVEFVIRVDLVGPLESQKLAIYDGALSREVAASYDEEIPDANPRTEVSKPVFSKE